MKKILFTVVLTLAAIVARAALPVINELPAFGMENNGVNRLPAAKQASPVELKEYKQSTFDCAYFDWWYFGYSEAAYFGYVLFNEEGKEVAFTVMSQSETNMCAYYDDVKFKEEDERDVEAHYYMSTYWILNCPNGVRLGGENEDQTVIANSIKEVRDNTTSMLALRSGTYYLRVYELFISDGRASMGSGYDQVKFTLEGIELKSLKAEVASDKKTAQISWVEPAAEDMPAGAHLYLSVQSGEKLAYDNGQSKKSPENPLTVKVEEGRSYQVVAQYVTSHNTPLGSELTYAFTVGTNEYIPTNLNVSVVDDDNVVFTWSAPKAAQYYGVDVYQNGFLYGSYTTMEQKLTKSFPAGTYTWEVAAFEKGEDGLGYPITDFVKGDQFVTKTASLPEGSIELDLSGMLAAYIELDPSDPDYREGKYVWSVILSSNTVSTLPEAWVTVYSDHQYAISGVYSNALNNVALGDQITFVNTTGQSTGLETASDVTLKINFEGFDMDYQFFGYYIPYYSGELRMTCTNGKSYYGKINSFICPAMPYADLFADEPELINMTDEDPNIQGIDEVSGKTNTSKRLENGQLIIEKNGVRYNVLGGRL